MKTSVIFICLSLLLLSQTTVSAKVGWLEFWVLKPGTLHYLDGILGEDKDGALDLFDNGKIAVGGMQVGSVDLVYWTLRQDIRLGFNVGLGFTQPPTGEAEKQDSLGITGLGTVGGFCQIPQKIRLEVGLAYGLSFNEELKGGDRDDVQSTSV